MGQHLEAAYAHCEALLRSTDKDRWLAALFAPADRRRHLHALDAFSIEVAAVRSRVTQPLAGELRLQWWCDVLEGEARGEVAANPVVAALIDTIERRDLSRGTFLDAIEAYRVALYGEAIPEIATLEQRFDAMIGGPIRLKIETLTERAHQADYLPRHAAVALGIAALIRDLPQRASDGFAEVPDEIFARHGAGQRDSGAQSLAEAIPAALSDLRQLARRHLAAIREGRRDIDERGAPAFLPVNLVEPLLRISEAPGIDPFAPLSPLPQWRRQWVLWRAARRGGIL